MQLLRVQLFLTWHFCRTSHCLYTQKFFVLFFKRRTFNCTGQFVLYTCVNLTFSIPFPHIASLVKVQWTPNMWSRPPQVDVSPTCWRCTYTYQINAGSQEYHSFWNINIKSKQQLQPHKYIPSIYFHLFCLKPHKQHMCGIILYYSIPNLHLLMIRNLIILPTHIMEVPDWY